MNNLKLRDNQDLYWSDFNPLNAKRTSRLFATRVVSNKLQRFTHFTAAKESLNWCRRLMS